ncbi:MAG: LytTR family DNA-binding domain-containing protein, partial [Pseudomonadota bacterium]
LQNTAQSSRARDQQVRNIASRAGPVKSEVSGRAVARFLLPPAIAGVILTILAPLGTQYFGLVGRALYWIGLCFAGGIGALLMQLWLDRWKNPANAIVRTFLRSLGATLAVAPFVLFGVGSTSPTVVGITLFYIAVIALVITAVSERFTHRPEAGSTIEIDRPPLMERLPLKLQGADLYAAVSEDHYLRIYTSKGDHMLLMRLVDVPDLALPLEGLTPHRSWWVAKDGVADIIRQSGKLTIHLKNGETVPVSRSGAARIKEAGWLP